MLILKTSTIKIILIMIIIVTIDLFLGELVALKLEAEFPVKCASSEALQELSSGSVSFDSSNCTSHVFVSNGW